MVECGCEHATGMRNRGGHTQQCSQGTKGHQSIRHVLAEVSLCQGKRTSQLGQIIDVKAFEKRSALLGKTLPVEFFRQWGGIDAARDRGPIVPDLWRPQYSPPMA